MNKDELILKELDFFSPNGRINKKFFHYDREVMLVRQDGEIILKDASYSHGLALDVIFSSYFKDKVLVDKYKNNCIKMCELLALDGNIVLIIENDTSIVCVPNKVTQKQVKVLLEELDKLNINDNFLFYIWRCIDDKTISDIVKTDNKIIGGYEFNQEKVGVDQFKNYLRGNLIKKRR